MRIDQQRTSKWSTAYKVAQVLLVIVLFTWNQMPVIAQQNPLNHLARLSSRNLGFPAFQVDPFELDEIQFEPFQGEIHQVNVIGVEPLQSKKSHVAIFQFEATNVETRLVSPFKVDSFQFDASQVDETQFAAIQVELPQIDIVKSGSLQSVSSKVSLSQIAVVKVDLPQIELPRVEVPKPAPEPAPPQVEVPEPVPVPVLPIQQPESAPQPRSNPPEYDQIVSFYGHPGVPIMGVLGHGKPDDVAERLVVWTDRYDELNGPRGAVPAFHLIVGVAQRNMTRDGSGLYRLSHERISEYVEVARRHNMLLFLDTQIGWSDPLKEVKLLEPFLREPFVHIALDPEFATQPLGVLPGTALGFVTGAQVNEVQRYLAGLVEEEGLTSKILMVHQFATRMMYDKDLIENHATIELSIDMDGFGSKAAKLNGYRRFALKTPSERPALKLFFDWDTPVMTPEQVQNLENPPDLIIYQ